MPGSVRQWTFFALVKKTSLHFECWKATDRLVRAGYNMTWPPWDLIQSQRYCVFINPVELYWIAAINKYFNMGCVTFGSSCISSHLCVLCLGETFVQLTCAPVCPSHRTSLWVQYSALLGRCLPYSPTPPLLNTFNPISWSISHMTKQKNIT
jgi:hypothetical protein